MLTFSNGMKGGCGEMIVSLTELRWRQVYATSTIVKVKFWSLQWRKTILLRFQGLRFLVLPPERKQGAHSADSTERELVERKVQTSKKLKDAAAIAKRNRVKSKSKSRLSGFSNMSNIFGWFGNQ